MIIPRKYELFGVLMDNDPQSRELIIRAFNSVQWASNQMLEKTISYNKSEIPAFFDMGCGIPGEAYRQIIKGLDELDNIYPYDNNLTYADVSGVEYASTPSGSVILFRLITRRDNVYRIVSIETLENTNGETHLIDGWVMDAPPWNDLRKK